MIPSPSPSPSPCPSARGFSLVEAIAALAIFGLAVIVASSFLDVQMSAARRLEARADLVRAAETLLESVRGGVMPLTSGDVDLSDEFQPMSSIRVRTTLRVTPRPLADLYEVQAEARAMVRSEEMVVSITTQVWRP
jgi:prepilin-type N-terminal cleavage/methylation domain-containing protein